MNQPLNRTRNLIGWLTGSHYGYSDGEIWPEWRYHTAAMVAWRLALKLGISDRIACRQRGDVIPRLATTMIGEMRAHNIVDCMEMVAGIHGDVVDCGVWRGGSTILLKSAVDEQGHNRTVYCCDTFEGFDEDDAKAEGVSCPSMLAVSESQVWDNFKKHGVEPRGTILLKGKVQKTLKAVRGPVALLRVDVDMKAPTLSCLEQIYPLMPAGAVVIVDDYGCTSFACKEAVDEFLSKHPAELTFIDRSGVWWRKP